MRLKEVVTWTTPSFDVHEPEDQAETEDNELQGTERYISITHVINCGWRVTRNILLQRLTSKFCLLHG